YIIHTPYPTQLLLSIFFVIIRPPPRSTLFPYTTLFRSALLNVARRMVVVIIETDFPPGKEFGALRQIAEFVVMCRCGELGFMRVNSGRGINPFVALGKWQRGVQRAGSAADGKDIAYSSSLRPRQHVGSIGIEF